jgi:hypothetical protein
MHISLSKIGVNEASSHGFDIYSQIIKDFVPIIFPHI